jgi:hypothetical protein
MSTYWTAETITLVERTYVKGAFRGKYHAERSEAVSTHHVEYFQMHIYQAEVTLDEVRKSGQGEFPETTGLRDFEGSFAQPVNGYDPTADAWFQLHIYEPKLEDIVLSKIVREGSENLGTITGTLYGYVTRQRTEERKVAHETPDPIPNIPISNTQGWTRTPTHEFIYRDGTRYRRDYYRHAGGSFCWGEWYAVTQPVSFLSVLQFLSGLFFCCLALLFLISLSWAGLFILGFLFLCFLFSRISRSGFGATLFSGFYGLVLLFFLVSFGIGLYNGFTKNNADPQPFPAGDKRNYTATRPVKLTNHPDAWIIHHRAWQDNNGNAYEGDVRVLKSAWLRARRGQEQLPASSSFADVYRALSATDAQQLDGVYALFDSLKKAKQPDTLSFANMLVSFVQDIPYSTVTAGDCGSQNYNNISGPAANNEASCVGHVPFGVQSPVEFMANFQGDCDTRTLFLFTLFDHYPAAILSSVAFRHSLLGLKLPLPGAAKKLGAARYVLWETTAKGFSPGQLSPRVDNMDYWDFTLINTSNI